MNAISQTILHSADSADSSAGHDGLAVSGVSHDYEHPRGRLRVLDDVNVTVSAGTLTAIVGPSGGGKSTLLKIIAGIETPRAGQVWLNGVRIDGRPGGVAYHPQEDALLPWLTTLDNATIGAETCGEGRREARNRAEALLEQFGLAGFERAWPEELSGGMRQRVALLRTVLMPQGALVLDEPFGALDALTRRQMQEWLLEITAREDRPTVLVTHDIEEALLLADRVLVMNSRPATVVHEEVRPAAEERRREREEGRDHEAAQRVLRALSASEPR